MFSEKEIGYKKELKTTRDSLCYERTLVWKLKLRSLIPEQDKEFAYEFIKKLVLAWDPDYTKLTKEEASMLAAEASGFVNEDEINW